MFEKGFEEKSSLYINFGKLVFIIVSPFNIFFFPKEK